MTLAPERPDVSTRRERHADPSTGTGARVILRLAARQLRRSWATSLLVVVLIMLPIAGATGTLVYQSSSVPSERAALAQEIGSADAAVEIDGGPDPSRMQYLDAPSWTEIDRDEFGEPVHERLDPPESAVPLLPSDARTIEVSESEARIATPHGSTTILVTQGAAWDPLLDGRYTVLDGRAPENEAEVMVTPALLERLGAQIGDTLAFLDPQAETTIVGVLAGNGEGPSDTAYVPDGTLDLDLEWFSTRWFVEGWHATPAEVSELNQAGLIVFDRELMQNPGDGGAPMFDRSSGTEWAFVGVILAAFGFSAYIVLLISSAAFTVSARRQQRSLAVLASAGAGPGARSAVVLAQGALLGVTGGIAGAVLGVAGGAIAYRTTSYEVIPYSVTVPWTGLIAVLVASIAVGLLTAVLPARQVAKADVLEGLRGTRRPERATARRPLWGLILVQIGVIIAILSLIGMVLGYRFLDGAYPAQTWVFLACVIGLIVGPLLAQIGVIVAGHWILARLARLIGRFGVAPRLAARDAVANPSRIVPAFGAIAACAFLATSSFGGASVLLDQTQRAWSWTAPPASVSAYLSSDDAAPDEMTAASDAARQALIDAGAESVATVSEQVWDEDTAVVAEVVSPPECVSGANSISWSAEDGITCVGERAIETGYGVTLSIVAADELTTYLGTDVDQDVLEAFEAGGAIAWDPTWIDDGEVRLNAWAADDYYSEKPVTSDPEPVASIPAALLPDGPVERTLDIVLSPAAAQNAGLDIQPWSLVADMGGPASAQALDALDAESERISDEVSGEHSVTVTFDRQYDPPTPGIWMWLILGLAGVLVVAVSAVALGLARVERRPDDATLDAVGASGVTRRAVSAAQGLLIAGLGCVVGVLAGLIPVMGVVTVFEAIDYSDFGYDDLPWAFFGLLGLALPVVIALAMWLIPPAKTDATRRTAIA